MRLAADVLDADAVDRRGDEAAPQRAVELGHRRVGDDEGTEGAGRRQDLGASVLDAPEPRLEAERADRVAEPLETGARVIDGLDARCGGE